MDEYKRKNRTRTIEEEKKIKNNSQFIKLERSSDYEKWLDQTAEDFQRGKVDSKYLNTVSVTVNVKKGIASAKEFEIKILEKINFVILRIQNLFTQKFRTYKRIISKYVDQETLRNIMMEFKEADNKIDKEMTERESELLKIIDKVKSVNLEEILLLSKKKIIELIMYLFNLLDPKSKRVVADFISDCMQDVE
ncbi:MAG: hypothetical protein GYA14_12930 [Ignavibacteria bacterium]|nr:hypothetical protein [Ignavibacteria bacterium]